MSGEEAAPGAAAPHLRCGVVALVGWTNVGKSTLLNRLVGTKLAAVAAAPQTTRHLLTAVCHLPRRGQIVLVDTPGLHRPQRRLERAMVSLARSALGGADVGLLLVDAARGPGPGDARAARRLREAAPRALLALNKIDRLPRKAVLLPMMRKAVEDWGLDEALPISALTGEGCERLVERLLAHLPQDEPRFPDDFLTDQPLRALAAEWVREKLLERTRSELPHAIAVSVERWHARDDGRLDIDATILVERESQKRIVIGRQGHVLREVGTRARQELERFLGQSIYLRLWVKVRADWRNDERALRELGLG
jgi:GTP-binding protein Era